MNSSSSLTNSSSLVLFVCGSPRRFLLFCHEKARKKIGEKQKKDEFFSFSLFFFSFFFFSLAFFSLSFGQNKNFTLTKAFLPFYDAERRRQTRRRQRQRRTEEEEEESETKEEEEEEDINNNVSKSAS